MKKTKNSIKQIAMIQIAIFIMSFSGVFSKMASKYPFLSVRFVLFYGASVLILAVYAIVWQQILRRVDLTVAYSNRALSVVWSMIWGILLFQEVISPRMFLGAIIIMIGILVVVTSNE